MIPDTKYFSMENLFCGNALWKIQYVCFIMLSVDSMDTQNPFYFIFFGNIFLNFLYFVLASSAWIATNRYTFCLIKCIFFTRHGERCFESGNCDSGVVLALQKLSIWQKRQTFSREGSNTDWARAVSPLKAQKYLLKICERKR